MLSEKEILDRFDKDRSDNEEAMKEQWKRFARAEALYNGYFNQDVLASSGKETSKGGTIKEMPEVNLIRPIIEQVHGTIIKNRTGVMYKSEEGIINSDEKNNRDDAANALYGFVRSRCRAEHVENKKDKDVIKGGYGVIFNDMDFNSGNARGKVVYRWINPLRCGWDCSARAQNLTDANFIWFSEDYREDVAKSLFGEKNTEQADPSGQEDGLDCGLSYSVLLTSTGYESATNSLGKEIPGLIRVYTYQWCEYRSVWMIKNPLSEALAKAQAIPDEIEKQFFVSQIALADKALRDLDMEMFGERPLLNMAAPIWEVDQEWKNDLDVIFQTVGQPIEWQNKATKPVYCTAILSGRKVFKKYINPSQEGHSIQVTTYLFDSTTNVWYGMVDFLRDPALFLAKSLAESMRVLAGNGTDQYHYESGLIGDKTITQLGAKRGAVEWKPGALSQGKVVRQLTSVQSTGYEALIALFIDLMAKASGISFTYQGFAENKQESGLLNEKRVRQTMLSLVDLSDAVSNYQTHNAVIILPLLKRLVENNNGYKFFWRGKAVTLALDDLSEEYSIDVDETALTDDIKEYLMSSLSEIGSLMLQSGQTMQGRALMAAAIRYMPIAESEKQELSSILMQDVPSPEEFKAMQDKLAMYESQTAEATTQNINALTAETIQKAKKVAADTALSKAKTIETISKIGVVNA